MVHVHTFSFEGPQGLTTNVPFFYLKHIYLYRLKGYEFLEMGLFSYIGSIFFLFTISTYS